MALSSVAQEVVWLRQLTAELESPLKTATTIFEDNQSAICILNFMGEQNILPSNTILYVSKWEMEQSNLNTVQQMKC